MKHKGNFMLFVIRYKITIIVKFMWWCWSFAKSEAHGLLCWYYAAKPINKQTFVIRISSEIPKLPDILLNIVNFTYPRIINHFYYKYASSNCSLGKKLSKYLRTFAYESHSSNKEKFTSKYAKRQFRQSIISLFNASKIASWRKIYSEAGIIRGIAGHIKIMI